MHFLDIHTTAADKSDGDKLVTGTEIAVVDEVSYEGLVPGTEYELQATLIDSETGEPVMVKDGFAEKQVTGTAAFTPGEADGTQLVELSFDGTDLGGKNLVVYEKLFEADVQLASHEDPSDEGQTVTVVEIGTTLVDASDGRPHHRLRQGEAGRHHRVQGPRPRRDLHRPWHFVKRNPPAAARGC